MEVRERSKVETEEGLWEVKMKVKGGGLGGGEVRDVICSK